MGVKTLLGIASVMVAAHAPGCAPELPHCTLARIPEEVMKDVETRRGLTEVRPARYEHQSKPETQWEDRCDAMSGNTCISRTKAEVPTGKTIVKSFPVYAKHDLDDMSLLVKAAEPQVATLAAQNATLQREYFRRCRTNAWIMTGVFGGVTGGLGYSTTAVDSGGLRTGLEIGAIVFGGATLVQAIIALAGDPVLPCVGDNHIPLQKNPELFVPVWNEHVRAARRGEVPAGPP